MNPLGGGCGCQWLVRSCDEVIKCEVFRLKLSIASYGCLAGFIGYLVRIVDQASVFQAASSTAKRT